MTQRVSPRNVCLAVLIGIVLLLTAPVPARALGEVSPGFAWIRETESDLSDGAFAVAVDGSSVFIAGSEGIGDGSLRKYDSLGNYWWGRPVTSTASDSVSGVATNASGVYVVGSTDGVMEAITPDVEPLNPHSLTAVGSTLYFVAESPKAGYELWKSDGTRKGTTLVKDINSGGSSFPEDLTRVGSTLFFTANDTEFGRELWKSDGTAAGTVLVRDIRTTPKVGANLAEPVAVGSTLYFTADDGKSGRELWKSDGTPGGTVLVIDFVKYPGEGSDPTELVAAGSTLFFILESVSPYRELWKSDGTEAGTNSMLLGDFVDPRLLTGGSNTLYFTGNSRVYLGYTGYELWKSDGTATGTVLVKDILQGPASSQPSDLAVVGDTVFFAADDGTAGRELWRSDGNPKGTFLVKDINQRGGSQPSHFTAAAPTASYFVADDGFTGRELWRTDGIATAAMVDDIQSEFRVGSFPEDLLGAASSLFFTADDGSGRGLWGTSVASGSTFEIGFPGSSPDELTMAGGTLFFSAHDGTGRKLWTSDGTPSGTGLVVDNRLSATGTDAFIWKYTSAGSVSWLDQFGTADGDRANGVASDGLAIYVVGETGGSLPGQTHAGAYDAFVRKYSSSGGVVWTRQFGTSGHDFALAVATDGAGVYVVGSTTGSLTGQTNAGGTDAFIRKYDASGTENWSVQFGTTGTDIARAVAVDSFAVYVAGETTGALLGQSSLGGFDAFLRTHSLTGAEIRTAQFGSPGTDVARAVASDGSYVYVAGQTYGALPGQTNAGGSDAFVRKVDPAGTEAWSLQFGSAGFDAAHAIAVGSGAVYVAGETTGSLLDGLTSSGPDAFLARIVETPGSVPSLRGSAADGRVSLAWDPPADDGGVPVAEYWLYRGTDPNALELIATFDAEIRTYTDREVVNRVTYHYRIGAVNAIGEGPPSDVFSATPRPPPALRITSPADPLTKDPLVTVAGETEADAAVAIDGVEVPVAGDGTFSRTSTLADGAYAIDVVARDPLGQTTSAIVSVTVDTAPPALALTSPADGTTTSQAAIRVAGTTEPGADLSINGLLIDVGTDGAFAFDIALRDGENDVRATASDPAGNVALASVRVIVDRGGGPALVLTSPTEDLTNALSAIVAGRTESGAQVTVDGVPVAVATDGSFSTSVPLEEGPNDIAVVADSESGSTLVTRTVVRDTLPPVLDLANPSDGTTSSEPTLLVSGTTEPGASVTVNGVLAAVGPDGSFSLRIALANGTNGITVTARDPAGNARMVTRTVAYVDPLPGLEEELAETREELGTIQDALEGTQGELDEANRQLEETRDALRAASADLGALGNQFVQGLVAVVIILGGLQAAALVRGRRKGPPRTD